MWCENNGIDYIFGLSGTKPLARKVDEVADDIRTRRAIENLAVLRGYTETRHTAKSWDRERRTVARMEATMLGLDIRFVVTNLDIGSAEWIYDSLYCARGQAENLIKLHKTQLASDKTAFGARLRLFETPPAWSRPLPCATPFPKSGNWPLPSSRRVSARGMASIAGVFPLADGDGIGDFQGLMRRLDYLHGLGVTAVWLMPFQVSPLRDDGYDVADYYGVDPRYGTLGDFVEFSHGAKQRGIRVLIDLVVNHTSNEHPWFKEARKDPKSKYRDWYVWSNRKPRRANHGMVFPGVQKSTWSYDEVAKAWYFHRFYDFQPDLNTSTPKCRRKSSRSWVFGYNSAFQAFAWTRCRS